MRTLLMVSTALTLTSFSAQVAYADAPTLNLSGAINFQYVSESSDTQDIAGTDQFQGADSASQILFDITADADNGLAYGGRIDWRIQTNTIDELYMFADGGWGRLEVGSNDGAADDNVPSAVKILVGSYGYDGDYVAGDLNKQGEARTGYGSSFATSDNQKITYFTPTFGGTTVGASHTPDDNNGTNPGITEVGIWWGGKIGAVDLDVGIGHFMGTGVASANDIASTEIGAKVGINDVSFAAGFTDNGDSNVAVGSTADAGQSVNFAVAYIFGDAAVSLGYLANEVGDATGTKDELNNTHLDLEYGIAEGLRVYGGIQITESIDGSTAVSEDTTAIVLGTSISF